METNRRKWIKQTSFTLIGSNFIEKLPQLKYFNSIDSNIEPRPILLRSNENPYGSSPLVYKTIEENLKLLNRYQWEIPSLLISSLSEQNNVSPDNILLGAGSTEILDLVARYVTTKIGGNYLIADPSYDYWTVVLDNLGMHKIKIPVTKEKKIDLRAMQNSINPDTKLIYICNPNNPTGTICDFEALSKFVQSISSKITILIDEAYLEYSGQKSLTPLINSYPNLIIVKTFSKIYGLASARIGYGIAHKSTIARLNEFQSSVNGNISALSCLAAKAALEDTNFYYQSNLSNTNTRKYVVQELCKLNLTTINSYTNFIYFSLNGLKKDYFQILSQHNIQGTKIYEEEGMWTRISIGTQAEMAKFITTLH